MFIAASFTIAKIWKQTKCYKQMNGQIGWYIYIIKYRSTINKNEIMPFVTTWMDLDGSILNEIRHRKINAK